MGGKAGQISHLFFSNFDSSWLSAHFLVSPAPLHHLANARSGAGRWELGVPGRAVAELPPFLSSPFPSSSSSLSHLRSSPHSPPSSLCLSLRNPLSCLPKPTALIPSVLSFPPWIFKFLSGFSLFWTPWPLPGSGPRHLSVAAHRILPVSDLGLRLRKTIASWCFPT